MIPINSCERNIENWILRVNNICPFAPGRRLYVSFIFALDEDSVLLISKRMIGSYNVPMEFYSGNKRGQTARHSKVPKEDCQAARPTFCNGRPEQSENGIKFS